MCIENPTPLKIIKANIIIQVIKKFISCDVVIDIGIISLGKYTFFNMLPLATTHPVPC